MAADHIATADVWLTVKGAAAHALVNDTTILRAARAGRLVGYRINANRVWRFRKSAVDAWVMSQVPERQAEHSEKQHQLRLAGQ